MSTPLKIIIPLAALGLLGLYLTRQIPILSKAR